MSKNVSSLFLVSIALFFMSCAPKRVEMPSYEGKTLKEVLASLNSISEIETTFSMSLGKDGTEMRGDGALNISSGGDMSLRIYSLGFLAMELTSDNGVIRSTPYVDKNKALLLTQGLRDCLFWWDIDSSPLNENGNDYYVSSKRREIWFDRKTFLPTRQKIHIEDGNELDITYENPARENDVWYQSKINIRLSRYSLSLLIKKMNFKT